MEVAHLRPIRYRILPHDREPASYREVAAERFDAATRGFVSDGNCSVIDDIVFERVDTVIVLALPWQLMLWRTFKRTVRRLVTREELWNGNRESFRLSFLSSDSVIYDLYRRRDRFMTFAKRAEAETPSHIKLVIVRSARELNDLYKTHGLVRRSASMQ